jgi:hypothetical protein
MDWVGSSLGESWLRRPSLLVSRRALALASRNDSGCLVPSLRYRSRQYLLRRPKGHLARRSTSRANAGRAHPAKMGCPSPTCADHGYTGCLGTRHYVPRAWSPRVRNRPVHLQEHLAVVSSRSRRMDARHRRVRQPWRVILAAKGSTRDRLCFRWRRSGFDEYLTRAFSKMSRVAQHPRSWFAFCCTSGYAEEKNHARTLRLVETAGIEETQTGCAKPFARR